MENMDKGLKELKWVLILPPKIPQMSQNLSAQFVCPSPKVWDFNEIRLHWASVVRVSMNKKVLHMHLIEMHLEKYHPGCGVLISNFLFLALM